MTIRSRPATDEYRENYDRIFGPPTWTCDDCGQTMIASNVIHCCPKLAEKMGMVAVFKARQPLSPHDAEEHPSAD